MLKNFFYFNSSLILFSLYSLFISSSTKIYPYLQLFIYFFSLCPSSHPCNKSCYLLREEKLLKYRGLLLTTRRFSEKAKAASISELSIRSQSFMRLSKFLSSLLSASSFVLEFPLPFSKDRSIYIYFPSLTLEPYPYSGTLMSRITSLSLLPSLAKHVFKNLSFFQLYVSVTPINIFLAELEGKGFCISSCYKEIHKCPAFVIPSSKLFFPSLLGE